MSRSSPFAFLVLFVTPLAARAQVAESWSHTWYGTSNALYEIAGGRVDADGPSTAFGSQRVPIASAGTTPWISRLDPSGAALWQVAGPPGGSTSTGSYLASFADGADELACGWIAFDAVGPQPASFAMVFDRIDAAGQRTRLAQFGD